MLKTSAIAAVAMLALSTAGMAQEKNDPPQKAPKEKKICRTETETGSMMPHSVCHTRAEWDQIEHDNDAYGTRFRPSMTHPQG